ncbi:hypothetical protein FF2_034451 [Malus domestica]
MKRQGKSMIWDTLAFNPDDMRYSCSRVAYLQRYYREEKKLSISRDFAKSALSDVKKSLAFFLFAGLPGCGGWRSTYIGVSLTTSSIAIPLPFLVIAM